MQTVLLRHGRTAWNAAKRTQGRTDIPLSDDGRAELAGRRLPPEIDSPLWLSSPLRRAHETAAILRGTTVDTIPVDARLTEMNFGEWEGFTYAELQARDTINDPSGLAAQERLGLDMCPPGGETPREVLARFTDLLRDLDHRHPRPARVVMVCHKGLIRAALAGASGWDMTGPPPWKIDWRAAQVLAWTADRLSINRLNVPLLNP